MKERSLLNYNAQVCIPTDVYERVNRLLAIDSLEDMSDEELLLHGANTNYCEGIFAVEFADGSSLNFDLCSGTSNYFDDVVGQVQTVRMMWLLIANTNLMILSLSMKAHSILYIF